jgi:hypothetical protein
VRVIGAGHAGEPQRDGSLIAGEFRSAAGPAQFIVFELGRPPASEGDAGVEDPYRLGNSSGVDLPGRQLLLPAVGEESRGALRGRGHLQRVGWRPGLWAVMAHRMQQLVREARRGLDQAAFEGELRLSVEREGTCLDGRTKQH